MAVNGIIKDAPVLFDDLVFVWEGFTALALTRQQGNPIQFAEIESWLNLNGIENFETRQEFAHLIRVMDSEYITFFREKNAKS